MTRIALSVLVLAAVQALHLYEEVQTGFRRQFPLGEIPKKIFVTANVIGFAFALTTAYLCFVNVRAGITAAWVYTIAMLINSFLHMGMMVNRRSYFPGGVTACLILPLALSLVWLLYHK